MLMLAVMRLLTNCQIKNFDKKIAGKENTLKYWKPMKKTTLEQAEPCWPGQTVQRSVWLPCSCPPSPVIRPGLTPNQTNAFRTFFIFSIQCCGWDFGMDPDRRIRTSDKRIRIRLQLWLRILLFSSVTFNMASGKYFCLLLFEVTFTYIIFQRWKVIKKSQHSSRNQVFLIIFAWWKKNLEPDPYLVLMDPAPTEFNFSFFLLFTFLIVKWEIKFTSFFHAKIIQF